MLQLRTNNSVNKKERKAPIFQSTLYGTEMKIKKIEKEEPIYQSTLDGTKM